MAAYVKIYDFVEQLCLAKHNFDAAGHVIKVALARSTDPPTQSDTILGNITQPTGTNYAPIDVQNTIAEVTGTLTLTGTKCVFTAGAGDWQTFRYVMLYNEDQTSPVDPLIAYWDYAGDLQLLNGESFSVKFNGSDTTGTIFTLS